MNVNICTKENDIPVKYGMINLREEREAARTSLKYILTDLTDIKASYIRLGFHLYEFERYKYYEDFGYSSFSEFIELNLSIDKSAVSRCIAVSKNFCKKCAETSNPSMFIEDKYADYSYSQLVEMIPMNEELRRKVKPEMTISQIRELKKKNVSQKSDNVSQVAMSQQENNTPDNHQKEYMNASVLEVPEEKIESQPELPILKNNDLRKEWLSKYKDWGLWYRDDHIDVNYYKYDFPDGSRLIVAEYPKRRMYYNGKKFEDNYYYHLLEKNYKGYDATYDRQYIHATDSETYLVEFLKRIQK